MHPKITTDPDTVVAGLAALPPPEPWAPTPDHVLRAMLTLDAVVRRNHPQTSGPQAEELAARKIAELAHGPHRELLDAAAGFVRTLDGPLPDDDHPGWDRLFAAVRPDPTLEPGTVEVWAADGIHRIENLGDEEDGR